MADVSSEDILYMISGFYSTIVLTALFRFIYNRTPFNFKRRLNKLRMEIINFDLHLPGDKIRNESERWEIICEIATFERELEAIRSRLPFRTKDESPLYMQTVIVEEYLDRIFIRVTTEMPVEGDLLH